MEIVNAAVELALLRADPLSPDEARRVSYVPTGLPRRTSSAVTVVGLQQTYLGVPIRTAVRSVSFHEDGDEVTGEPYPVSASVSTQPTTSVVEAAHAACLEVTKRQRRGKRPRQERPRLLSQFPTPVRSSVLAGPGFVDSITASLKLVPTKKGLRLAWEVHLTRERDGAAFAVLVSAGPKRRPEVLAKPEELSAHAGCCGFVSFPGPPRDVEPPDTLDLPRGFDDFPGLGGTPPTQHWVHADQTRGNNVTVIDLRGKHLRAIPSASGKLEFLPSPTEKVARGMVNAFYLCNFMHDFFYLLGFDESKLNFQDANLPGIGKGGDPVSVRVVDERNDSKPASFFNKLDGSSPELKLRAVGPSKLLTALDADIVIHEYVHGVTDRMVGDGSDERPFREEESVALAEGICDYYALSIQNWYRRKAGEDLKWTFGAWVTQKPNGLRERAYGDDFDLTYGSLKTFTASKAHDAGQVWAQTLFDLNAVLSFDDSEEEGDLRGWQTVFNALAPLHPQLKGPHFLHARDAIMAEVRRLAPVWRIDPDRAEQAALEVFGKRGMGPLASSPEARFKSVKEHVTP